MNRIYNFSAGPAILPQEVLEEAGKAVVEYKGSGMGIIEMSHRSKPIDEMSLETEALVKELLGLGNDHQVLFLQGGASQQFFMVPMNLVSKEQVADYLITGVWSEKALKEAKILGKQANVAFSSKDSNFSRVPKIGEYKISANSAFLHFTTNNTIFGTQFPQMAEAGNVPLVADMSSDMFSRPFDPKPFGLVYAGAQKNLGPAGVTLVIIRNDLLARENQDIPTMLKYSTHAEKKSMYNTPPVFAIYVMNLTLKWIKKSGGLSKMESMNREKARLIYDAIDKNDLYKGHAEKDSRSQMNITWNLTNKDLEAKFLEGAKALKMDGLKGHRSVGGLRASVYNAMPKQGCQALADYMNDFAEKNS